MGVSQKLGEHVDRGQVGNFWRTGGWGGQSSGSSLRPRGAASPQDVSPEESQRDSGRGGGASVSSLGSRII